MRQLGLGNRAVRALAWIGIGYLFASGEPVTVAVALFVSIMLGVIHVAAHNRAKRRAADRVVEETGGNARGGSALRAAGEFRLNTPRGAQVISGTIVHGDVQQIRNDWEGTR